MSFFLAITLAHPVLAKEVSSQSESFVEEAIELAQDYELDGLKTRLLLKLNQQPEQSELNGYEASEVLIGNGMAVLQFDTEVQARKAALKLSQLSFVDSVEFDREMEPLEPEEILQSDPKAVELAEEQVPWYLSQMGFDHYKSQLPLDTYRPIVVAVCDTGINYSDPYFEGKIAEGAWDFAMNDDHPDHDGGYIHGSQVSGIILETAKGMNVQILPLRVLPGTLMTTILGVTRANDCHANIINLSLVYYVHSQLLEDQVKRCIDQGGVVVVSAGNSNYNMDWTSAEPAHDKNCITVGAVEGDYSRCNWGNGYIPNYGSSMDFVTFGSNIQVDGLKEQMHAIGTSFSTPIISGILAVLMGEFPQANYYDLYNILVNFCQDLGDPGWDQYNGFGIPMFFGQPYNDVKNLSPEHLEAIDWLRNNEIMTGLSAETFGPSVTLNRAMLSTILCRLAGNPVVEDPVPFQDVIPGSYYENAVKWAYKNGILTGYDQERFGPSDALTREQLSLVLYRLEFGQLKDLTVQKPETALDQPASQEPANEGEQQQPASDQADSEQNQSQEPEESKESDKSEADLQALTTSSGATPFDVLSSQFGDAQSIAEFARDSMPWAIFYNLIEPVNGISISPSDPATREVTGVSIYRLFQHRG